MVIGAGKAKAFKYLDSRVRIPLGPFSAGILIGDTQAIFDTPAAYSIETVSYCNIGIVHHKEVKDILVKHPHITQDLRDEILWNPHDYAREQFIKMCRKHIKYLKDAEDDALKQLYYQSKMQFLESSQMLFECG